MPRVTPYRFFCHIIASIFLLALSAASALAGEIINYDGTNPPLQNAGGMFSGSVVPLVSLTDNSVTVSAPGAAIAFGGFTMTGSTVEHNSVIIGSGATIDQGSGWGGYSFTGSAIGNSVTINGGTVDGIGGYGKNANDNHVIVNTGSTVLKIIGGYAFDPGGPGSAMGNSVTINGGVVTYDVIGGVVDSFGSGSATGNTVTISGSPSLASSILYGGEAPGDERTGNTLNVQNSGMTVKGIQNFANYNFYLPTTMTAGQTMLTVNQGDGLGGAANISGSVVGVGINGGTTALNVNDRVTLINSATGLTATGINTKAVGLQGIARIYDFDLTTDANNLYATVVPLADGSAYTVDPGVKSLSEGHLAGLVFVNQGSDLIIGQGMYSALRATQQGGLSAFGTGSGDWSRYNTGSHVDVSGFSMLTGLAWRQPLNEGKSGSLLAGAFFEGGWGNYNSYNSYSGFASVHGDGDTNYYGGGILGRYDAPMTGPGNIYVDASFRAGRVNTNFSSSDLRDFSGRNASYDSGSAYYGAHAGLGYLWNINEQASLDFSTKYIWTHQNSDSVTVVDDPVRFNAADSQRWRTGARFSYIVNDYITPYVGAYYDHEFDGKARGTINDDSIKAPKLTGGTGVGELGLTITPVKGGGLSFDLGVQGYTGVREGVTGTAQLKYEF